MDALVPGQKIASPALIEAETTMVLLKDGDHALVNRWGWLDIALASGPSIARITDGRERNWVFLLRKTSDMDRRMIAADPGEAQNVGLADGALFGCLADLDMRLDRHLVLHQHKLRNPRSSAAISFARVQDFASGCCRKCGPVRVHHFGLTTAVAVEPVFVPAIREINRENR